MLNELRALIVLSVLVSTEEWKKCVFLVVLCIGHWAVRHLKMCSISDEFDIYCALLFVWPEKKTFRNTDIYANVNGRLWQQCEFIALKPKIIWVLYMFYHSIRVSCANCFSSISINRNFPFQLVNNEELGNWLRIFTFH